MNMMSKIAPARTLPEGWSDAHDELLMQTRGRYAPMRDLADRYGVSETVLQARWHRLRAEPKETLPVMRPHKPKHNSQPPVPENVVLPKIRVRAEPVPAPAPEPVKSKPPVNAPPYEARQACSTIPDEDQAARFAKDLTAGQFEALMIIAHAAEPLGYHEISRKMGVPAKSVRSHVNIVRRGIHCFGWRIGVHRPNFQGKGRFVLEYDLPRLIAASPPMRAEVLRVIAERPGAPLEAVAKEIGRRRNAVAGDVSCLRDMLVPLGWDLRPVGKATGGAVSYRLECIA